MNHLAMVRQKIWKNEEVKALIQSYKLHKSDFCNYNVKVVDVWQSISQELGQKGIQKSGEECDKKWRNLKSAFKKVYCDTDRTQESKYQWEFFEELSQVMLSDQQLRRAAPILINKNLKFKRPTREQQQITHIYTLKPNSEEVHKVSFKSELLKSSESQNIESDSKWEQRDQNKKALNQSEIKEIDIQTLDMNSSFKHGETKRITEDELPSWFQNSFLMKYEMNVNLMQHGFEKMFECQKLQIEILEDIAKRVVKIENLLTIPKHS